MTRFAVGLVFIVAAFTSCKKKTVESVDAKVLALNPANFHNKNLQLSGNIASLGPSGVYFVLEDRSAQILVSTEQIPSLVNCPPRSTVSIEGSLRKAPEQQGIYFSANKILECRK